MIQCLPLHSMFQSTNIETNKCLVPAKSCICPFLPSSVGLVVNAWSSTIHHHRNQQVPRAGKVFPPILCTHLVVGSVVRLLFVRSLTNKSPAKQHWHARKKQQIATATSKGSFYWRMIIGTKASGAAIQQSQLAQQQVLQSKYDEL